MGAVSASRLLLPFRRLIPNLGTVSAGERLRASLGAMLGLLLTGFVSRLALGPTNDLPLLIAPMGASAVLLFAVPASPLAQPWSILGGNIVAALIGITCGRFIVDPVAAAAVACACAIGAMLVLRCLHPPSGAVALTAVLGGPAIHAAGYGFAVWPVGLNSLLLLGSALLFNNATGRRYPHLSPALAPAGARTSAPAEVDARDIEAALRRHDEVLDIDRDDLLGLVRESEALALSRQRAKQTCGDVMKPAMGVPPETSVEHALACLAAGTRRVLAVVDADRHLLGTVSKDMILQHLRPTRAGRASAKLFQRSIRFAFAPETVGEIMQSDDATATPETPLAEVAARMVGQGMTFVPVVDAAGILRGIVDMPDVLAAVLAEASAARHLASKVR